MKKKRKLPRLTEEGQVKMDLASEMAATLLKRNALPLILIGSKTGSKELSEVDYMIVSPLEREKIRYVLTRVIGLIDGTIQRNN